MSEKQLPEGKVRTVSGDIIDRADACFRLREVKNNPNLLQSITGTLYVKGKGGQLRRYPPKEKKNKGRNLGE